MKAIRKKDGKVIEVSSLEYTDIEEVNLGQRLLRMFPSSYARRLPYLQMERNRHQSI